MSENMAEYYCEKCKRTHKSLYRGKPSKVYKDHLPDIPRLQTGDPVTPPAMVLEKNGGRQQAGMDFYDDKHWNGFKWVENDPPLIRCTRCGRHVHTVIEYRGDYGLYRGEDVCGECYLELCVDNDDAINLPENDPSPPNVTPSTSSAPEGPPVDGVGGANPSGRDGDGTGEAAKVAIEMQIRNINDIRAQFEDLQEGVDGDGPPVDHGNAVYPEDVYIPGPVENIPDSVEEKITWRQRLKNWWRGQ
jgi:hypothetical protein